MAALRLRRGRHRRKENKTLLEGPHLVETAVRAGAGVEVVFALEDDEAAVRFAAMGGAAFVPVSRAVLDRLAPTEHPRGPIAVVRVPPSPPLRTHDAIVLWGVSDPGNVGTLLRTAAAFDVQLVVGPGCADPWSPKVLRAAAGAHFTASPVAVGSLAGLQEAGLLLVATVAAGGEPPEDLPHRPVAALVGNEAHGLPDDVVGRADAAVTVPTTAAVESLNAAVAGAIVAYELRRRRS